MTTAVLCCDFQNDILGFLDEAKKTELIGRAKQILEAARNKNLLIIFIRVAFRSGYPEISPNNLVINCNILQWILKKYI
jgi:nicotinamidase-related amidase